MISIVKGSNFFLTKNKRNRWSRFRDIWCFFWVTFEKQLFEFLTTVKWRFILQNLFEELRFSIIFRTSGRWARGKHFSPSYCDFSILWFLIKSMRFVTWPWRNFWREKFLAKKFFFVFFLYFCPKNLIFIYKNLKKKFFSSKPLKENT